MIKRWGLVIGLFTGLAVFSFGQFKEYLAHCNFAFGTSYSLGGKVAGLHPFDITLTDGYGDTYHFTSFSSTSGLANVGFNLSLSVPFYYHQYFSVGAAGQIFLEGIAGKSPMYYSGGLYAEGIYKRFSLRGGVHLAGGLINKRLSPVVAAWPGDPGFYNGKDFLDMGDYPIASSNEFLGLSWNLALKYYPFKSGTTGFLRTFHFLIGYCYIPGITVSGYDLELAEKKYNVANLPEFKVDPVHNVSLMLGFGL